MTVLKSKNKNLLVLLEVAIVSLFIVLIALQGNKRFTLDEMDFPTVSKAASQTMRPVWYKGELTNQQSGLFHPPLYIHSLAIFIRGFGFSEMTVRLFGLICALITSFILINILRLFNYKNRWGEVLLLGLFLLNPYTIACATVPDIDTTIMPITMLLLIYVALRLYWKKNLQTKYEVLLLSALFALNLWTKLTTPLMLPFFVLGLLLVCKNSVKESFLKTLKFTVLGIMLFLVTFFIYTKLVSLPYSYTFTFLIESFAKGTSGNLTLFEKVFNNASNVRTQIYWFTIPLTFVYLLSLVGIAAHKTYDKNTNVIRLIALFSLAVFIFYMCLIAPFGGFFKYPFPVFGLMIMNIVFFYHIYLSKIKINLFVPALVFIAAFVIETRFFRDDAFLNHAILNFRWLILISMMALLYFGVLYAKKTSRYAQLALVYFFFVVMGFQLGVSRIQAIATYPTKYLYGQQGMNDAINYLKLHTEKNEVIWSMKDIGFYVNDRYYENYPFFFNKALEPGLISMINEGKIRYYVATTGIGEDRVDYYKDIAKVLDTNATKVATFGNFVIYESKNNIKQ
jgi:4-amino-4-deoxy-L-arabinose transferase-like glycosyltransferase